MQTSSRRMLEGRRTADEEFTGDDVVRMTRTAPTSRDANTLENPALDQSSSQSQHSHGKRLKIKLTSAPLSSSGYSREYSGCQNNNFYKTLMPSPSSNPRWLGCLPKDQKGVSSNPTQDKTQWCLKFEKI